MIEKLGENHRSMRKANLNNIPIKEDKMLELIEALRSIFEWLKSSIMFNVKSFSSVYFTVLVLGEGCIQLGVGPRGQVLVGLYTVFTYSRINLLEIIIQWKNSVFLIQL